MEQWDESTRHWTPQEGYATGDVLLGMLHDGWVVVSMEQARPRGRALIHDVTLANGESCTTLPVLDCPAIHVLKGQQH